MDNNIVMFKELLDILKSDETEKTRIYRNNSTI